MEPEPRSTSRFAPCRTFALLAAATFALTWTCAFPASTRAATLQYAWGPCNSGTYSYPWLGPGRYRQGLCAANLGSDVRSVHVRISVGPSVPDAWTFAGPNGSPGCEPASAFRVSPIVVGAGNLSVPAVEATFTPHPTDPRWTLEVNATFDPASPPDPAVVTGIASLEFDLSNAVVGPSASGFCGDAATPICFGVVSAVAGLADGSSVALALAQDHLRWNDASNVTGCPASVPAIPATWGALRAQYR